MRVPRHLLVKKPQTWARDVSVAVLGTVLAEVSTLSSLSLRLSKSISAYRQTPSSTGSAILRSSWIALTWALRMRS